MDKINSFFFDRDRMENVLLKRPKKGKLKQFSKRQLRLVNAKEMDPFLKSFCDLNPIKEPQKIKLC